MKSTKVVLMALAMFGIAIGGNAVWAHEEHAHKAPHEGQVVTVGSYHYEILVKPGEIDLYVLDDKLSTLPLTGKEGTLLVQLPDNTKKTLTLEPAGEYFKAAVDLGSAKSFIAIATIKIDGKSNVGRFTYPPKEHAEEHHGEHKD